MLRIRTATKEEIRYAIMRYHYSHAVPVVSYGYSVFNGDVFCGVVCFGNGANMNIASPFGLLHGEVYELVRVALNGKQGHGKTSEAVAMCLKRLHHEQPQLKIIVSYADVDQNHIGTIYQATNWIYLGLVQDGTVSGLSIKGKKTHKHSVSALYGTMKIEEVKRINPNVKIIRTKGKRKYAYPFTKAMRKLLESQSEPYPKTEV